MVSAVKLSAETAHAKKAESGQTILEQLRGLLEEMGEALGLAKVAQDVRGYAISISEMRKILELAAKLTGELDTKATITNNILVMPDWIALRDRILHAVEPFPQAWAAVERAIANGGDR